MRRPKARLFDWNQLKYAVLNLDDAFGSELAEHCQDAEVEVIGYGLSDEALQQPSARACAWYLAAICSWTRRAAACRCTPAGAAALVNSPLLGRFNAENLLGTIAVLLVSGVPLADALREVTKLRSVPGRMQTLGGAGSPAVVVDYAHTPDALEKVLHALREVTAPGGGKIDLRIWLWRRPRSRQAPD